MACCALSRLRRGRRRCSSATSPPQQAFTSRLAAVGRPVAEDADRAGDDRSRLQPADLVAAAILAAVRFDDDRVHRFERWAGGANAVHIDRLAGTVCDGVAVDDAEVLRTER